MPLRYCVPTYKNTAHNDCMSDQGSYETQRKRGPLRCLIPGRGTWKTYIVPYLVQSQRGFAQALPEDIHELLVRYDRRVEINSDSLCMARIA